MAESSGSFTVAAVLRRVPLYVAIPLCLATPAITWWQGTRGMDFLSQPSEAELTRIREQTRSSVPGPSNLFNAAGLPTSETPSIPPPIRERPAIDPGDSSKPPLLSTYSDSAGKGAAALIELASYVEDMGYPQRSLVAWERVLDMTHPDEAQREQALAAVQRLRPKTPPWLNDPASSKRLRLEVTVPPKAATPELTAALQSVADDVESVSSGLVKCDSKIETTKKGNPFKGLSLKITGPGDKPPATGSFILEQMPPPDQLDYQLYTGVFRLTAAQLGESTPLTAPAPLSQGGDPRAALWQRITRMSWLEFAKSLQPPPPEAKDKEKEESGRNGNPGRH